MFSLENLNKILSTFEPINLSEMDSVALMNRTDTKYIFRFDKLEGYLKRLLPYYRILEVNKVRSSKYETLYFDTPDFQMYRDHHRGKLNRYKIRHRIYVDSDLHFFEIKFKNNKGRTIKSRIRREKINSVITDTAEKFLTEKTNFSAQNLVPKLWSNCSRITLVNRYSKERLTLDINLQFKNDEIEKNLPNIVIAEVKQEKLAASPFIKLMKEERVKQGSISKYCYGVIFLYNEIKSNNFRSNLHFINKINDSGENEVKGLIANDYAANIKAFA
ncbi:MAG: polyphosphate polymerase domain-containing protein [Bacteroidia bacterium]